MSKLIDLTKQQFGLLTVIEKDTNRVTNNGSYWVCRCECGNIKSVKSSSLRKGEIISCGCYRLQQLSNAKRKQSEALMLNKRFGKLLVEQRSDKKGSNGELYWWCLCDCGRRIEVRGHNLRRTDGNQTVSCGCAHKSIGANNIINCLTTAGIDFIDEYTFLDLPKSRFDFAIIKENQVIRLIEFDGEQHFQEVKLWGPLSIIQERDKIKNEYALSHNIPLVRIPYWERDNITLEMILGPTYEVREVGQPTD